MQALTIKELGQQYFPHSTSKSASTQLVRWLRHNKNLWADLAAAGYLKGQRILTPLQVALVYHHLGEP